MLYKLVYQTVIFLKLLRTSNSSADPSFLITKLLSNIEFLNIFFKLKNK